MLRYYYHQSFFFFFFSHARMCVSLSSQRSSCISVWFVARDDNACVAEPASRFERSSPSEVDPPYNVAYILFTTTLFRPHRSSISLAWNGRTVFVVANVNRQTNVPPLWFTFITSSFESSFRAESRQNDRVTSYSRDAVCFPTGKSNSFQFMNGN